MGIVKIFFVTIFFSVELAIGQTLKLDLLIDFGSHRTKKSYNLQDTSQISSEVEKQLQNLYKDGFLLPKSDISKIDSNYYQACIYSGEQFRFISIDPGNLCSGAVRFAQINKLQKNAVSPQVINQCNERIVKWYENNGFPFVKSNFIVSYISNDSVSGRFNVDQGPKIFFDSIIQKGNYSMDVTFLHQYLGIKKNEIYCEKRIKKISKRFNNLKFVEITEQPAIVFTDSLANIILITKRKKANRFDGIVGFAPNPTNSNRLTITGDVSVGLVNSFNHGESMEFNWRSLGNGTQDLKSAFQYPYIFKLPFGVNAALSIYKKDSSYVLTKRAIGIDFLYNSELLLSGYYESGSSSVLDNDLRYGTSEQLQYANLNTSLYGIKVKYNQLDYIANPRRGWIINLDFASGNKKIVPDSEDDSINSQSLNTSFARFFWNVNSFLPLGKSSTIKFQFSGGLLQNTALLKNELILLGGLNSLRGFDESSILASQFSYVTAEYRYLFERNSFLCLFTDIGQSVNTTVEGGDEQNYWSVGTGISFQTKAGIFYLAYALGRNWLNPFNFRNSKIHFGLTAQF